MTSIQGVQGSSTAAALAAALAPKSQGTAAAASQEAHESLSVTRQEAAQGDSQAARKLALATGGSKAPGTAVPAAPDSAAKGAKLNVIG